MASTRKSYRGTETADGATDITAKPAHDAPYSDAQLIVAARMYYIDELSQSEIAKTVGVSQAKVSRMLALARRRGIVRISVPEYNPRDEGLERALVKQYKLQAAVVLRRLESQSLVDVRSMLGFFAAPIVSQWVTPSSTVAVAGGRTLRCVVERMHPAKSTAKITVVQGMGNIDETTGSYDALEIGRLLSKRWGSQFLTLNTPALLANESICRQLKAVNQVKNVFERLSKTTLALVGIGYLHNSIFRERNILREEDIALLDRAGAVGEIMGRFYDADGQECDTPFRKRIIGMDLQALRNTKRVVGVVAGSDRTDAIVAAIRGGLLKALVIDDVAAQALLESRG